MTSRSDKPCNVCLSGNSRRGKWLTFALCVALALPGLAAAKKPSTGTAVSCAVLLPAEIDTGSTSSVKVARVPSYPGGWTQPTISIDVAYPGDAVTQNNTQTINRFDVTYALATFAVPARDTVNSTTANVTVTVTEPLSNNGTRVTNCSATTTVLPTL